MACTAEDQTRLHGLRKPLGLLADLLLLFAREIDEMVVLCANEERDGGLVEAAALSVPLFDAVEGGFAGQVEHEEDGDGVVANEGEHVDEFALPAQVPDAEGDFGVADGDCLFHEVDACEGLFVRCVGRWAGVAVGLPRV